MPGLLQPLSYRKGWLETVNSSPMLYRLLADIVVVAHFLFVCFVVAGGFLIFKWKMVMWVHLPAVAWAVAVEWMGWICPLTPLETRLRELAGLEGYASDFISHYLFPLLYPATLTKTVQVFLGSIVLILNLVVYSYYFRRSHTICPSGKP